MGTVQLRENEVLNDLLGYDNLKIIQRKDMFSFSLDSVLLANFMTVNKRFKKMVDLGTGNAPIPLFLSTRTKVRIIGVEIQDEAYDIAIRNVNLNGLTGQIEIIRSDIKGINKLIGSQSFDAVVCNPPFFKITDKANMSKNAYQKLARHEVMITLEEIVKEANLLLTFGGYFSMVHRPDRLLDIFELFRKYNIEPKRLRLVYPKYGKESNMVLLEGQKGNKGGLRILAPLYVHDTNNEYSAEVKTMFMRE